MENQEQQIEQPASPALSADRPAGEPTKKSKPKWLVPVIVVVGIIVLGAGVWAGYNYLFKSGPPEPPKETDSIPRFSEFFKACLDESDDMFIDEPNKLKEWYGLSDEMPQEEIERAIRKFVQYSPEESDKEESLEIITDEEVEEGIDIFETKLTDGIMFKTIEYSIGDSFPIGNMICRSAFMDEEFPASDAREICQEKPECCSLPELKDQESAKRLVEIMYECISPLPVGDLVKEVKRLKYGYFIESYELFETGLYLTDSGCSIDCLWLLLPYLSEELEHFFGASKEEPDKLASSSCEYKKGEYELRVYDSEGNVTGLIDGKVYHEIPRSVYENGNVAIFDPQDDFYEYEMFCIKEGNYQFSRSNIQGGEVIRFEAVNIPISSGETHRYQINWKTLAQRENGAILLIDKNSDGKFEKEISIDGNELTCEDFLQAE